MQPHIDSDPETLPCVRVALPITASVSFRQMSADGDEDWRSIPTETGPRRAELLQLAAVPLDDSPTDVMTRRWWEARFDVWEPPVPVVPQLPLELLMRSQVAPIETRPARKGTDWRSAFAPLSLLVAALSLVPPVSSGPSRSPVHARAHSLAAHLADVTPPAAAPAVVVVAPLTVTIAAQHRVAHGHWHAPRHTTPRRSMQLVREAPF